MKAERTDSFRESNTPCSAQEVAALCRQAGFSLNSRQADGLASYLMLLMRWNRAMNLVGARHWRQALEDLVLDSLWLARFLQDMVVPAMRGEQVRPPAAESGPLVWDLGAGAGLPGIPLRFLWTEGTYCMVEAREKRALFLMTALARLKLPGTSVFRGRVEQYLPGRLADIIVSRGFMPWLELLNLVKDHLRPEGRIILMTRQQVTAPDGWRDTEFMTYPSGDDQRYFCAFAGLPTRAPS